MSYSELHNLKGDRKFEIQRPTLEKMGNPFIDALINLAKNNEMLKPHLDKLKKINERFEDEDFR